METTIMERARQWASNPIIDEASRQEVQTLIDAQDEQQLEERFCRDLEFGTGGMRAFYQAGTNRINRYTIRRAAYALCLAVKEAYPHEQKLKIALSYDNRHGSTELSSEAASVFAAAGIQALLFHRMNPVPLLSYSVRHHQAHAGVMVTASHNPKEYNGFKVYWSDGAQVTPPHDQKIIGFYQELEDLSKIPTSDFNQSLEEGKIVFVGEEVEDHYIDTIARYAINSDLALERGHELNIVYTPIHGTGLIPCQKALKKLGFNHVQVPEGQKKAHGDFPTVKSPNPENPEAMKMAVDLMLETKADIAFGSDPDGDRLGIALEHEGEVVYPNGNQIGTLMLYYILENKKKKNELLENSYIVKSIVTTPLLEKIASSYGVKCYNTLTGFKWICGKMNELEKNSPEEHFIFATEESFGYLHHPSVRDKDGISSVLLASEMALWYKSQGLNLIEALDHIYKKFGFSHETLLSLDFYGLDGAAKIGRIMESFRQNVSEEFAGHKILSKEDYLSRKKLWPQEQKTLALEHPKSNVLGLELDTGDILYLRPSGTEPKIKFYIMIHESEGELQEKRNKAYMRTQGYLKNINTMVEEA